MPSTQPQIIFPAAFDLTNLNGLKWFRGYMALGCMEVQVLPSVNGAGDINADGIADRRYC